MAEEFVPDVDGDAKPPEKPIEQSKGDRERIRHVLFGSPKIVKLTIHEFFLLGYAEPGEWSKLQKTSTPGQVMSVLTKYRCI
ncbi:MAG: hypothetical protein F6K28_49125 [Microcoleus sp. SIO2G3]|nr:hypothetical protein [Microcoleus sp. SIO2G3]